MKHPVFRTSLVGLLMLYVSPMLAAQAVTESSLLSAEEGSSGTAIGAVVEEVHLSDGGTVLLLSVPEDLPTDQKILLITPEGNELPQSKKAVIVDSYDEGRTGIRLFVDRKEQFEFRLRLMDISDHLD